MLTNLYDKFVYRCISLYLSSRDNLETCRKTFDFLFFAVIKLIIKAARYSCLKLFAVRVCMQDART